MKTSKVSIIIPCYNIEKHIKKCIDSVLSQSFSDFELLLIDDGSTDQTLAILKKFEKQDQRIKVFTQSNQGVSYTRNRGIELAAADYVMFIDGDDWIEIDMIECIIEQGLNKNVMNVCGMIHERNKEIFKNNIFSNLIKGNRLKFEKNHFITLFPSSILSSPCCKVYNRDILIEYQIRFGEDISYQEDLIFNLLYLNRIKEIKILPVFKYHYIEHQTSSSSRFHINLNVSMQIVSDLLISFPNYNKNEKSIQTFNIDQILKLISNYSHKDANLNLKAKYNGIKKILKSDDFENSKNIINEMAVGNGLKVLLKHKNVTGILIYFYLNKLLK
jgi:glycosyltransferase involved in cell wall biosynthesis